MVEEDFGFESDLDQVRDHFHVICSLGDAVHAQRHEEVLGRASQLCTHNNKEKELYSLWLLTSIYIFMISHKQKKRDNYTDVVI